MIEYAAEAKSSPFSDSSDISYTDMKVGGCVSECLFRKRSYLIFSDEGLLCSNSLVELM